MASLTFDKARWYEDRDGFWLAVRTKERAAAAQFCEGMADKPHTAELKEQRKKRSLDANAYFWVLAGELAARTGRPPDDIYRDYVRAVVRRPHWPYDRGYRAVQECERVPQYQNIHWLQ